MKAKWRPDAAPQNPKVGRGRFIPSAAFSGPANVPDHAGGCNRPTCRPSWLRELGSNATIGPMLIGMEKPGADRAE